MKKIYRRMLFFSSTVVFLGISPLVILYALGYRAGTSTADPLPVGVVYLESLPRLATVWMSDENIGRTPHAITDLPAGNATIALKKDGYQTWKKNIPVTPGTITELRGVRLFPESLEPKVLATSVTRFSQSPDRQLLAVIQKNNALAIMDAEGTAVTKPLSLRKTPQALLWSPNSASLLITNTDRTYSLAQIAAGQITVQQMPLLTGTSTIVWDQRIPSRLLLLNKNSELLWYNVTNGSRGIISNNVISFATSKRFIFVANDSGQILKYNLQGQLVDTQEWTESTPIRELLITPEGDTLIWQDDGKILLQDGEELKQIVPTAEKVMWSPDGRMVLLQPAANEVYVYNVSDERSFIGEGELHLVARLSRPIAQAQWFAGGQHLLLQVDDELIITEIDTRDHAKQAQLDTTNLGDAQASIGEDGYTLFYLKKGSASTELMALPLLLEEDM